MYDFNIENNFDYLYLYNPVSSSTTSILNPSYTLTGLGFNNSLLSKSLLYYFESDYTITSHGLSVKGSPHYESYFGDINNYISVSYSNSIYPSIINSYSHNLINSISINSMNDFSIDLTNNKKFTLNCPYEYTSIIIHDKTGWKATIYYGSSDTYLETV